MDGFNRMTSNPCLGILIKKCPTKVLYWNGRGLANSQTRLVLNSQTRSSDFGWTLDCFREHPSIFLEESPTFSSCCQLQKSSLPNLWCLSRQNLSLVVLASSDQHCSFQICFDKKIVHVAAIYGSTNYTKRRKMWQELHDLQSTHKGAWSFIGTLTPSLVPTRNRVGFPLLRPLMRTCWTGQTRMGSLTLIAVVLPMPGLMAERVLDVLISAYRTCH